ncbi:hypothetical protein HGB07_01050 [Candidatus Roizmanbacteria bacterium]|nr:hypothetical protein [Candidatus Roizmanbacteria bacterium]
MAIHKFAELVKKHYVPVILILLAIGTLLRFYRLGTIPYGPEIDEASVGYNAYVISKTLHDEWGRFLPTIFEAFGDFKNPLYIYLTSIPVKLFGLSLATTRFINALAGSLAMLTVYGISWQVFKNRWLSLLTLGLFVFSPPAIFFSRIAGDGIMLSAFLISAALYSELIYLNSKKLRFAVLASSLLILSMFSYNLGRIVGPLLFCLFLLLNAFVKTKRSWLYLVFSVILLAAAGVLIYQQAQIGGADRMKYVGIFGEKKATVLEVNEYRGEGKNTKLAKLMYNKASFYGLTLAGNYLSHFGTDFLSVIKMRSEVFESYYPPLYLVVTPFYYLGLFLLGRLFFTTKNQRQRLLLGVLLFWILVSPLPSTITEGAPSGKRDLAALGSFEIVSVFAFFEFLTFIKGKKLHYRAIGLTLLAVGYFVQVGIFLSFFFHDYMLHYSYNYQKRENLIAEYITAHYQGSDTFMYSEQISGRPYIYPVFHLSLSPETLWKTREYHQIDRWNSITKVDKMKFVPAFVLESFTCDKTSTGIISLFLSQEEYMLFLSSPCARSAQASQSLLNPEARLKNRVYVITLPYYEVPIK